MDRLRKKRNPLRAAIEGAINDADAELANDVVDYGQLEFLVEKLDRVSLDIVNVDQARMVTAKGRVVIANNRTNPDLFWALRGGGGGSFGIVTSMKVKTYPAPIRIAYAMVKYRIEDFPIFFKAWQTYIVGGGEGTRGRVGQPPRIQTLVNIDVNSINMEVYSIKQANVRGPTDGTVEDVESLLTTWFPQPQPLSSTMREVLFPEFMTSPAARYARFPLTSVDQLPNVTRERKEFVGWRKSKSFYVDRLLERGEDIAELYALLRDYLRYSSIVIQYWGGAIETLGPSETALVHKGPSALYLVLQTTIIGPQNQTTVNAMQRFFDGTKRLLRHTQSYQNYLDEDLPDYLERYYGANLERLVAIKRKVDPDNVFHNPQSIPVTLPSS